MSGWNYVSIPGGIAVFRRSGIFPSFLRWCTLACNHNKYRIKTSTGVRFEIPRPGIVLSCRNAFFPNMEWLFYVFLCDYISKKRPAFQYDSVFFSIPVRSCERSLKLCQEVRPSLFVFFQVFSWILQILRYPIEPPCQQEQLLPLKILQMSISDKVEYLERIKLA